MLVFRLDLLTPDMSNKVLGRLHHLADTLFGSRIGRTPARHRRLTMDTLFAMRLAEELSRQGFIGNERGLAQDLTRTLISGLGPDVMDTRLNTIFLLTRTILMLQTEIEDLVG